MKRATYNQIENRQRIKLIRSQLSDLKEHSDKSNQAIAATISNAEKALEELRTALAIEFYQNKELEKYSN